MWPRLLSIFSHKRSILIILRGAPASGKTTVGNILKEELPNTVSIPVDQIIQMIAKEGKWAEFWATGQEAARNLTKHFLGKGFNVVVEELLFEISYIDKIIKIGKKFNAQMFVFELTAPLEVLIKRKEKGGSKMKSDLVQRLKEMVSTSPCEGAIRIDTTKKSPEECAEFILKTIKKNYQK